MKLRKFYELDNGVFKVRIESEDWSAGDQDLMADFGEPEVDLGGDFDDGYTSYSLPNTLKKIMSDSPFIEAFDIRDNSDAELRANLWADDISSRITTALNLLRTNNDSYSREEVETV